MIRIEHPIEFQDTYDLTRIGSLDELLFFDIETTGFSGDTSSLYLIGCTWHRDGRWNMTQYFADGPEAERQALTEFFELLKRYRVLIHFNGDGFDIPYLLKRCAHHKLNYSFDGLVSLDIYKKIRPLKKLLGLDSLKQKAIERFLGVDRTDVFSGGELIEVYKEYLRSRDDHLFHLLILHNEDDLKGMPCILPILNYPDLLEGPLSLAGHSRASLRDIFGREAPMLDLCFESPCSVPVGFEAENGLVNMSLEKNLLKFRIELYEGELKFFYPNYKDYFYLPLEDTAVHKSVGEFVDKSARVRATAKTCYTRKNGLFIPQFEPLWEPALKREFKDPVSFTEYRRELFEQPETAQQYGRQLMRYVTGKSRG